MQTNKLISVIVLWLLLPVMVTAQFGLPVLPYSFDALTPHIDSVTMRIHYNNHHRAYVNNLNAAIDKHPELKTLSLEELLVAVAKSPEDIRLAIRNNGGGHYNHSFFWTILSPDKTELSPKLSKAINTEFGSFERFKSEFEKVAMSRFGSGWAWLIVTGDKLKIISTPNQDNPIMGDAPEKGVPILALDLWEHAYYLNYQSNRSAYIKAFWNIVNWDKVSDLYRLYR